MWNICKSSSDISSEHANYHGYSSSSPGLVGYWKVNEGTGSTLDDISTGNHNMILYNTPGWDHDDYLDHYLADVESVSDYYPYGMQMPGRHGSENSDSYRYGFQAQEKDDEVKGAGNSLNYKYRMHDPRIGRFFAVDPLAPIYSYNSPYAFSENRVIEGIELEGLEVFFSATGAYIGMLGDVNNREIQVVPEKNLREAKKYISWAQDLSENGQMYQSYNTEQAMKLSIPYKEAGKSAQGAIAESIYKIWIEDKIPLKSITAVDSWTFSARTIDVGVFEVNPKAGHGAGINSKPVMNTLYDQVNTWYHEEQHNRYEAEGNTHSSNGFYHFEIGKIQEKHWSFQYTTDAFKDQWSDNMYKYISSQKKSLDITPAGNLKQDYIKIYNSNVDWYNKRFDATIDHYSQETKK